MTTRRKRGISAPLAPFEEREERGDEIASQAAAKASVVEQEGVVLAALEKHVIEADLAELVHDDRGIGEPRMAQQVAEQRRLAAPEESRDHRDRDRFGIERQQCHGSNRSLPIQVPSQKVSGRTVMTSKPPQRGGPMVRSPTRPASSRFAALT